MPLPTICQVAIPTPLRRTFDYLSNPQMPSPKPGARVLVPFGRRQVVGMVLDCGHNSQYQLDKLKTITELIDHEPLIPSHLFEFYRWAANYYQHPIGDALANMLPAALRSPGSPTKQTKAWQLSTLGKGLPESALSRAPKQQALLNLLQKKSAICREDLEKNQISSAVLRELLKKQLVEETSLPPEQQGHSSTPFPTDKLLAEPHLGLNTEQQAALDAVSLDGFSCTLLDGATGSGKTEVYLQLIEQVLANGKQALVLIPEINLTPQTLSRFQQRFACPVVAMHSGLTDRQREQAWQKMRRGEAGILIGTRSAIFTPLQNPGMIVVDEEHDSSFKQQEGFRYSARDLAVVRAKTENIPVLLGSATPSLESLQNCQSERYQKVQLRSQQGSAGKAQWQLVSTLNSQLEAGLNGTLINEISSTLEQGNQVLVFLNRRGYAPRLHCLDCAWQADCDHCSALFTVHQRAARLICHHCEKTTRIPHSCPNCQSQRLSLAGQGTERSEETLRELFPHYPVHRIDRDTTRRKHRMSELFEEIQRGQPCILVGTQMLAKGHHFPKVTLVAMLDVDNGLFSPDFRASEKMGQLITQVAGRSGRGDQSGKVLIQSQYCDHPLLTELASSGYGPYSQRLLAERQATATPPFRHLVIIRAEAASIQFCQQFLNQAKNLLSQLLPPSPGLSVIGPLPAAMERRKGQFRYQLSILSDSRQSLQPALSQLALSLENLPASRKLKWAIDVDPVESI